MFLGQMAAERKRRRGVAVARLDPLASLLDSIAQKHAVLVLNVLKQN
jgi:hypothetical protein